MTPFQAATGAKPQVLATVTACTYKAGAGRALAFGLPTSRHFLISYNFFAHGELHTGQFTSKRAMAQGTLFPMNYDPALPRKPGRTGAHVLAFGLIGSLVLSLAWLALLHGCL